MNKKKKDTKKKNNRSNKQQQKITDRTQIRTSKPGGRKIKMDIKRTITKDHRLGKKKEKKRRTQKEAILTLAQTRSNHINVTE